jgi:hypothetical protein
MANYAPVQQRVGLARVDGGKVCLSGNTVQNELIELPLTHEERVANRPQERGKAEFVAKEGPNLAAYRRVHVLHKQLQHLYRPLRPVKNLLKAAAEAT